jgi:hypothetical protein
MPKKPEHGLIPLEIIERCIYFIRGQKVMVDFDLAALYQVPTKALNQAVRRNFARFPDDFMFQLTARELADWRSQIVTSNPAAKMGLRRSPLVFTEHGVGMLSSVLQSARHTSEYRRRADVRTTPADSHDAQRARRAPGGHGE